MSALGFQPIQELQGIFCQFLLKYFQSPDQMAKLRRLLKLRYNTKNYHIRVVQELCYETPQR